MIDRRGNCIRLGEGRFEVLGLISMVLPGPWWWQAEDLNDPHARGTCFRCFEEGYLAEDGNLQELANLLVADVSADPTEPDISLLQPEDVDALDRRLEAEIRRVFAHDGRTMTKWMSSHLNVLASGKGVTTAYIARDQGRERQYLDIRISVGGRKVIVGGCFDIARKDDVAAPVYWASPGGSGQWPAAVILLSAVASTQNQVYEKTLGLRYSRFANAAL